MRFITFLFLFFVSEAEAYVRSLSDAGMPLFWSNTTLNMKINPINASGLSLVDVSQLFNGAFSSWTQSGARVGFNYTQSSSFPTSSAGASSNAIFFSSNSNRYLDFGVVALTEVWHYTNNGQIVGANMIFNDRDYLFTANAGDTGKSIGSQTAIYLQDVATHEAGHAYGLDHSTVNKSTLIYMAFSGQFKLGNDDISALNSIYPNSSSRGSITGVVKGLNGGIFGAQVSAINLSTGNVEAGVLTQDNGSFRLGDIPAGNYAIFMEPLFTNPSTISNYFQTVNHSFCGGTRFRRGFYSQCSNTGEATLVAVDPNRSTEIGVLAPSCNDISNHASPTTVGSAKMISSNGGAVFGNLNPGETHYYRANNISGSIIARALSYTLYSKIDVTVEILDSSGSPIDGVSNIDNVENPMPGGHINYDARSSGVNLPLGDYIIKIAANPSYIPYSEFAAGWNLEDSSGYYLLSLNINGQTGIPGTSDMSSCLAVNNFRQSASISNLTPDPNLEKNNIPGCGTISSKNGSNGGPFSSGITHLLLAAIALRLAYGFRHLRMRKRKLVRI